MPEVPDTLQEQQRWLPCYNSGDTTIPPFAVVFVESIGFESDFLSEDINFPDTGSTKRLVYEVTFVPRIGDLRTTDADPYTPLLRSIHSWADLYGFNSHTPVPPGKQGIFTYSDNMPVVSLVKPRATAGVGEEFLIPVMYDPAWDDEEPPEIDNWVMHPTHARDWSETLPPDFGFDTLDVITSFRRMKTFDFTVQDQEVCLIARQMGPLGLVM